MEEIFKKCNALEVDFIYNGVEGTYQIANTSREFFTCKTIEEIKEVLNALETLNKYYG